MGSKRLAGYALANRYYDGDHRVQLTTRERQYLQASGIPYAENYCETIVDIHSSRLFVSGFNSDNEQLGEFARDLWDENYMDAEQDKVHSGAIKLADYFLIVEPNEDGLPLLCPNQPHMVKAVYDSGRMVYAVKVWNTSQVSPSNPKGQKVRRMNIYWPDQIEKFYAVSVDGDQPSEWIPWDDGMGERWWTMDGTPSGEPIGIPVIHFANKPNPHYGVSHLRGQYPQQDALNKSLIDHFWIMDAQGWPQQWGAGVKASDIKRHPGSLWTVESDQGKFGQLDPADPEKSIASIESQIKRMAARSATPLHLMLAGEQLPSGESLKTSESGLERASVRRQNSWRHKWVQAVRIAARVEKAFGQTDPPVDSKARLACRWEKAGTRTEVDEANVAVLWDALGVSRDTIHSRLGFDPVEEKRKREAEGGGISTDLLAKAQQMTAPQAPTRSEEAGGGQQPAQKPGNRVVTP